MMFILRIKFLNSVSSCLKNISPLRNLPPRFQLHWWNRKLVAQNPTIVNQKKKVAEQSGGENFWSMGYGAWHITGPRSRELFGTPKIFPPTSLGHFFFMAAQLIICSTKFYPWHVGFLCSRCAAEKLNQI